MNLYIRWKVILLGCLISLLPPAVNAQVRPYTPREFDPNTYGGQLISNTMKYWKVRGRLIGDMYNRSGYVGGTTDMHNGFMVVGTGDGKSLPPEWRIPTDSVNQFYEYLDPDGQCTIQKNQTGWTLRDYRDNNTMKKGIIGWGDATVQMGHYIAALAFEWQLLHRGGESTADVEQELYDALKAIERLDMGGEVLYGNSGSLNGFLVRDDVPWDFAMANMGKNYDLVKSDNSCPSNQDCESSKTDNKSGNSMSYDQITALMMGLAVVDKLFDGNNYNYNGEGVLDIVGRITDRMITYCSKKPGWVLVDPKDEKPVCRGPYGGLMLAYPLSVAGRVITGDNNKYRDGWSQSVAKVIWFELKKHLRLNNPTVSSLEVLLPASVADLVHQNAVHFPLADANVSAANDNISMILQSMVSSRAAGQVTLVPPVWIDPYGKMLINQLSSNFKKEIYDLYGSVLIGFSPKIEDDYWRYEFAKLPCACNCTQKVTYPFDNNGCPHDLITYGNSGSNGSYGGYYAKDYPWVTSNRWEHWSRAGGATVQEYPGIDYLESFAGYLYKYHGDVGLYKRLRVGFAWNVPFNVGTAVNVGTNDKPFKLKAVFDLTANSHLYAGQTSNQNPNVEFVAGSSINLVPPFYAEAGSNLNAHIGEYDCSGNVYTGVIESPAGHSNDIYYDINMYRGTSADTDKSNLPIVDTFKFGEIDTLVKMHDDVLTYSLDDTAAYDTTIIKVYQTGDTLVIGLDPCYDVDENNNIINICDAKGVPAASLARSVRSVTIYPNPTNSISYLEYELYEPRKVIVRLLTSLGQDISNYLSNYSHNQSEGKQRITINAIDLPRGVYYCEVWIDDVKTIKKLTVY